MDRLALAESLNAWFEREARLLPWRTPEAGDIDAWAVLVSEVMLQQTQASRVVPLFGEWIARWPTPQALAAASPGDAVRAWGRLGYPRRALWLHRAATTISTEHGGEVPEDLEALLALTGVGAYTARAVLSFAFAKRQPVVDTNTRRLLARLVRGQAAAGPPHASDLDDMTALLPEDPVEARTFNAAAMELGAVICTPRTPACEQCPVRTWCEWRGAGYPDNAPAKRPTQAAFQLSDRQVRGRIMALLRETPGPVRQVDALAAARAGGLRDDAQADRAFASLIADGLAVETGLEVRLP